MKIAILCCVGPLDRFGYQHIYKPVAKNLSALATRVYLYSTTRNRANVAALLTELPNVVYVSNETTWFEIDERGHEVFNLERVYTNLNQALIQAKQEGMDCSLTLSINQYIPERAQEELRWVCQDMLDTKRPFEWFYRRYQLGDRLFHTDIRQPHLFNLQIDNPYQHVCYDAIEDRDTHVRHPISRVDSLSNLRAKDRIATVDCPLEMSQQDITDKMHFVRCYSDINPAAAQVFDWDHYLRYYSRKFSSKVISSDPLDKTGQIIAQLSQEHFVSWAVLQRYRRPSTLRRLAWTLRRWMLKLKGLEP